MLTGQVLQIRLWSMDKETFKTRLREAFNENPHAGGSQGKITYVAATARGASTQPARMTGENTSPSAFITFDHEKLVCIIRSSKVDVRNRPSVAYVQFSSVI